MEIRALASSSRGVDGSTGNGTLFYLSNEPKSARFHPGLPELGLGPPQLKPSSASTVDISGNYEILCARSSLTAV